MKIVLSLEIFEKPSNTKFNENQSSVSRVISSHGQKERPSLSEILRTRLKRFLFHGNSYTYLLHGAESFLRS